MAAKLIEVFNNCKCVGEEQHLAAGEVRSLAFGDNRSVMVIELGLHEVVKRDTLAKAEKQLARDQGAARMAARRQLLETKQSLVDAAFRQAEQQLLSLPEAEYIKLCAQLAAQASATGYEALIFCEADRKRVGQAVTEQANALLQKAGKPAELTLSAETRPMCGGVVLKDGLIETNCSIGTMISGLRPALSGKVAACLFG